MSGVRGPNSALTEFLRSQGINANKIRERHDQRKRKATIETENASDPDAAAAKLGIESIEDPAVAKVAQEAVRKRNESQDDGSAVCPICSTRFTLTVYSKRASKDSEDFLCRHCSAEEVKHQKSAPSKDRAVKKQRKKMAVELLELRFLTPPSLQDICISLIAEHIDSMQELGGLSVSSFNRISRILSKNRRLNPQIMQLFLKGDVTALEFWDCSNFQPECFNLIPSICTRLETLTLGMCGQLDDDNMTRIGKLPALKRLYLDGPFLVRKEAWLEFFATKGSDLIALSIKSVYRIDAEILAVLAENCSNLEELVLERLCQLRDPVPFCLLGHLKKLLSLELVDLEAEAWSDDSLDLVLRDLGSHLVSLRLAGDLNTLTDKSINSIRDHCSELRSLQLVNLMDITDNCVADMFDSWSDRGMIGLKTLSLERCVQIGDMAILAVLKHSGSTLTELNLNSLKNVSSAVIEKFSELRSLQKLDIGFIGCLDPVHIYKLTTSTSLHQILAFGNVRLTGMPLPSGVTVVGTM